MRALLVENQRPLLAALRRCLEEEGFQADVATDSEEANYKAWAVRYDAIVLSLLLPGEQAFTLLRLWRHAGLSRPVLALSAAGSLTERIHCLELGADDYLCRPFQLVEFLARVRALLRRAHRVSDPVLRVRDLEIDTSTRTVRRAGRPIRLTRREYALLQFLAFHRGRVVSRSMIWEHLYNEHDESTSNVVDVYIRYLRGKIDKGFDTPLILTRWGQGYLLRGDDHEEGLAASRGGRTGSPRPWASRPTRDTSKPGRG
jgi:DNA-binding response OmpR family regulator